jgi:hypothetical protein
MFELRFDPCLENAAPGLAQDQLRRECQDQDGKDSEFGTARLDRPASATSRRRDWPSLLIAKA